jgi:RNA polymerase sigma factor (sigma-70 family)
MNKPFNQKDADFTDAYGSYYAIVFGSLYSRTADFHAAEDLTQEVFIRFYSKMDRAVNHRAWLLTAVKHVLFEHYRRVKNSPDDIAKAEAFNDVSLTFVNGFRDTRIIIDKAMESINDETDQTIFDLVAVQNYTYEETGKELGLTKRQVKYRYGLIVRSVLEYLNKHGIHKIEDLL